MALSDLHFLKGHAEISTVAVHYVQTGAGDLSTGRCVMKRRLGSLDLVVMAIRSSTSQTHQRPQLAKKNFTSTVMLSQMILHPSMQKKKKC